MNFVRNCPALRPWPWARDPHYTFTFTCTCTCICICERLKNMWLKSQIFGCQYQPLNNRLFLPYGLINTIASIKNITHPVQATFGSGFPEQNGIFRANWHALIINKLGFGKKIRRWTAPPHILNLNHSESQIAPSCAQKRLVPTQSKPGLSTGNWEENNRLYIDRYFFFCF